MFYSHVRFDTVWYSLYPLSLKLLEMDKQFNLFCVQWMTTKIVLNPHSVQIWCTIDHQTTAFSSFFIVRATYAKIFTTCGQFYKVNHEAIKPSYKWKSIFRMEPCFVIFIVKLFKGLPPIKIQIVHLLNSVKSYEGGGFDEPPSGSC